MKRTETGCSRTYRAQSIDRLDHKTKFHTQLGIQGGRIEKGQCVVSCNFRNVEGTVLNFLLPACRIVPFRKGTTSMYAVNREGTMR